MIRMRTGFSFRAAVGTLEEYADLIPENSYAPITDRASSYGWIKWIDLCDEKNLAPVIGVELAVSPNIAAKRPISDYWLFFSSSRTLRPLNALISLAHQQFRYQPLLSYSDVNRLDGEIFAVAGHRCLTEHVKVRDGIYAGLTPAISPGLFNKWKSLGVPFVATGDNYYPTPDDLGRYQIICGRGASTQVYPQYLLDYQGWEKAIVNRLGSDLINSTTLRVARENGEKILLHSSNAKPKKGHLPDPKPEHTLKQKCSWGAEKLGVDLRDSEYNKRLLRELKLIKEKDFGDYFHIVSDICQWARKRMLVGPARGSAAGSLVCYLLQITTVDPLMHGLIFERFVDVNRPDLPDIDIDFSDSQRERVIEYIGDKYGKDHVSKLGTVSMYKARSALREVCGALNIPFWKMNDTLDSMIVRSSGDARALHALKDTLHQMPAGQKLLKEHPEIKIVQGVEGNPRHPGQHASAIIVNVNPLNDIAPLGREKQLMMDKKDAESLDLLKIDILGLTQLSTLEQTLELSGLPLDTFDKLPLDEESAYKIMRGGNLSGIFQVQGIAVQNVARSFKIEQFNDLVALSALARPGPLASGNADAWVRRRNGLDEVSYPHPIFEPYLKDTLGIVIYQEQVMEIGRHVGDLSWEQVTELRKAMSKSLGVEFFDQYGDPWKEGARKKGVSDDVLDKMWDDLCSYGSWSFNKSHAVSYGLITYWCAWAKANYPLSFAAATLNHAKDIEKQQELLRELVEEGFEYTSVDAEKSTDVWSIADGRLLGPLQNIKGIGPKYVQTILGARARGESLPPGILSRLEKGTTPLDDLYPVTSKIKSMYPDGLKERNIITDPIPLSNVGDPKWKPPEGEAVVIGAVVSINRRDMNEAVNIAKRGFEIEDGKTQYLNMWVQDDTGKCFVKITRWNFQRLGKPIIDRGRAGKALYAFKGSFWAPGTFRMLMVNQVRYLGDLETGREKNE